MQKIDKSLFDKYIELRKNIDKRVENLESEHTNHMKCKSGCDMCCIDYSILPIEFHSILNKLKSQNNAFDKENNKDNNSCVFLKNHVCIIYNERPIICRTHGLPLVFMNDEDEWELSACELNFTDFNFEEFTLDNTFEQDRFNSKLFVLNKEFVADFNEIKYDAFELVPIKKLLEYIN